MHTRSTSNESHADATATRPFFSVQRALAPSFFSESPFAVASQAGPEAAHAEPQAAHAVQRKCAACEAEKRILPQLEVGPVDDPLETEADVMADHVVRRQAADMDDDERQARPLQAKAKETHESRPGGARSRARLTVQRKCAACDADRRILPQLEVGPVDDPLETEADVMADHVVRRQAADMDEDERQAKPLQAKAKDTASSESTTSALETGLADTSGSGAPLAPNTRDHMEETFGADFSGVRVHTGAASAAMSEQIGARAFTYGTDIHFNDGEFTPGTERGTHLLAHELTHVVQQNSGVRRAPKRIQAKMQQGPLVFGPSTGMPKGNLIHNLGLLPTFRAPGLNEGLWIEPTVPGANAKYVGRDLHGFPDFYRDNAPDGRPIGIKQGRRSGFTKIGKAVAAPQPPATRDGPVRDLDHAPKDIELGDVKPGQSGEEHVGHDQLARYIQGIENTAKAVNAYQDVRGYAGHWNLNPGSPAPMKHLDIPDNLARPSTSGVRFGPLTVWEWIGRWRRYADTPMRGSCVVYKSSVGGIWAYEWLPATTVPENFGDDPKLKKLSERLEKDVKPQLHSDKKPAAKLQDSPAPAPRRPRQVRRLLRRKPKKHEKFDDKRWLGAYNPWRADAEKALGDPTTKQNVGVLEALTDAKKRTGIDPGIPQSVKERAKGAATVRHWVRYGKLYGWFRKTFDRVYVKLAGFAQIVKEKVKGLSRSVGSSGFGNWIKAAALALFKVAKKFGAWAVSIIVDKLLELAAGGRDQHRQAACGSRHARGRQEQDRGGRGSQGQVRADAAGSAREARAAAVRRQARDVQQARQVHGDREHVQHDRERGEMGHPHRRLRLAAAPRLSVEPRHSRARVGVLQDHGDVLVLSQGLRLGKGQRHPRDTRLPHPGGTDHREQRQRDPAAARGHRPAVCADHHQSQRVRYRLQGRRRRRRRRPRAH